MDWCNNKLLQRYGDVGSLQTRRRLGGDFPAKEQSSSTSSRVDHGFMSFFCAKVGGGDRDIVESSSASA